MTIKHYVAYTYNYIHYNVYMHIYLYIWNFLLPNHWTVIYTSEDFRSSHTYALSWCVSLCSVTSSLGLQVAITWAFTPRELDNSSSRSCFHRGKSFTCTEATRGCDSISVRPDHNSLGERKWSEAGIRAVCLWEWEEPVWEKRGTGKTSLQGRKKLLKKFPWDTENMFISLLLKTHWMLN